VSEDVSGFNYLAAHQVEHTPEAIQAVKSTILENKYPNESLKKLEARIRYLRAHPEAKASDAAWEGLLSAKPIPVNHINFANSKKIAEKFHEDRFTEASHYINHPPYYLCLAGLTGTGKTTFVEKYLHGELYKGEDRMLAWAQDKARGKKKYLFIDEANLIKNRQWSELNGIFNKNRSVCIEGVNYELDEDHVVIVAVNPLSYGDAREVKSIMNENGNVVYFSQMPLEVIYEDILKPIFNNHMPTYFRCLSIFV
jgi:adenylylsulfate kinase-like enzyme